MMLLEETRTYRRYIRELRTFIGRPLSLADGAAMLERQRAGREHNFLRLLELGVYRNPANPYRRLLAHAGIEHADVVALVRDVGLDAALGRLFEAGVFVRLDEVKGRSPVTRPGLEFAVSDRDFDNPMLVGHFEGRSGGSRSTGRRTVFDAAHLEFESAQASLFYRAFDLHGRPMAAWYPAPPSVAGLATTLCQARLGESTDRWFSQTPVRFHPSHVRDLLLLVATVAAGRAWGGGCIPWPEHASLERHDRVVQWLADQAAAGDPGVLVSYPSAAVRACTTALERGVDIAGTAFIVSGEPYTAQKAAVVEAAGAHGLSWYGMTETGSIGMPCAEAGAVDDVHLLSHKVATLQRPVRLGAVEVPALFLTTLLPSAPKLALNLESGDYGVLDERACGCAIGEAGLFQHLRGIRSHEKLTTQGMTFLGDDLLVLIDRVLPARHGGRPQDYQLVETEGEDGISDVVVVVSPRVGDLSEGELVETVLVHLSQRGGAARMMAEIWRTANALRLERREPHMTAGGKVVPLHLSSEASSP